MAEIVYVRDANWNLVQTTIKDLREDRLEQLEEENKKLKSDLAFERTMLDNVRAEYKSLQNVIKKLNIKVASLEWEIKWLNYTIEKLKEENQTLELWLDNKEKLNEEYRKQIDDKRMELSTIAEETIADLQSRIKELEENEKYRHSRCMKAERQYEHSLWDDELIYEEWLYD